MSKKRLVEYFAVAGVCETRSEGGTAAAEYVPSSLKTLTPLSEHTSWVDAPLFAHPSPPDVKVNATVLQRFPSTDRTESVLPSGLEIFCQPLGWYLTYSPKPPMFVDFILTAEDSSRLYCTTLNFHQLCKEKPQSSFDKVKSLSSLNRRHFSESATLTRKRIQLEDAKTSLLLQESSVHASLYPSPDEGCEENWTLKNLYGDVFQPVSLCLISRTPFFELLQLVLKSLYVTWISSLDCQQPLELEPLVAELLMDMTIPPLDCLPVVKKFGFIKELTLPSIHEELAAPYTSTSAWWLLKRVGVHQLLQLVSAVVSDTSILLVSSSHTVLTMGLRALTSIIHPFSVSHSLVPVLPMDLLEYTQLPSTYIMGIHSLIRDQIEDEMLDVVEVYLDHGRVMVPDNINLPFFPVDIISHLHDALTNILEPDFHNRDLVFLENASLTLSGLDHHVTSDEFHDKEVRAVFLGLMTILLGDYQKFVTVLRFNPVPGFYFNMVAYLASREGGNEHQNIIYKMAMSISFFNFCHEYSLPYRQCDYFDMLLARRACNPQNFSPAKLFARENILDMAEELLNLLPPCRPPGGFEFDMEGVHQEVLESPSDPFPTLNREMVQQCIDSYKDEQEEEEEAEKEMVDGVTFKRKIPMLDSRPTFNRQTSAYTRGLDSLTSCLDALFQSKIIEARKYVPSVIQALKSGILSDMLVPSLVHRFWQYGALLSSEQFDLVVKLLNSALVDEHSAMLLLPLTTVIYREVNPGVQQYACTCIQNHYIWSKLEFWRDAIYLAIQAELVRIYAEVEAEVKKNEFEKVVENKREDEVIPEQAEDGELTLRCRQRLRSSSPGQLRAAHKASKMVLSRSTRLRMRVSVAVPGLSEGVLPPNAEPVTSQEALHHLAKIMALWYLLPEEKTVNLMKMEENATTNQVILFVQRVINLRTPVELPESVDERNKFVTDLESFIGRLLHMVEVDLTIDLTTHGKIRDQVPDMIQIHVDSMAGLRKELKRLPISKPKVIKPPLVPGEVLLYELGIHTYLLQDGRDNGLMLPADGQIFLTSYRVIFLGTPCDPQAPSLIVARSVPISAIYRLKRQGSVILSQPISLTTVGGLQLRSVTAELLKIGFDDETSQMDIRNLEQHIVDLRNPSSITLGVKLLTPLLKSSTELATSPDRDASMMPLSFSKQQFNKNMGKRDYKSKGGNVLNNPSNITRVKILSDISQSPYCKEYERLKLGRVRLYGSDLADNKGSWRITTLNLGYAICNTYPAILAVPAQVTDSCLASLATQFNLSRLPVVTWKHPRKEAVLLRSSSFIPSIIAKKKISDKLVQNRAGVGIYNSDVENYLYNLVQVSPSTRPSLDLISMPPPTIEFDEEELKQQQASFRNSLLSPTNDAIYEPDVPDGENLRMRAQTYTFQIHSRVGSNVTQISRVKINENQGSGQPRRTLTKKRRFPSPQLSKRHPSDDSTSQHSSSSTASDVSLERVKFCGSLKEEPEEKVEEKVEVSQMQQIPRSANSSPTLTLKKWPCHKRTRSSDQVVELSPGEINIQDIKISANGSPELLRSPIDWEAVCNDRAADKNELFPESPQPDTTSTQDYSEHNSSPELLDSIGGGLRSSIMPHWDHYGDKVSGKKIAKVEQSPGGFSTLPTNPRDWMVMDALPRELGHWQANALYILGDRDLLQDIPEDLYPSCMFVPIVVPSTMDVSSSFKKLMRACSPSTTQTSFLTAMQESGWITQLTQLMQLGGAVVDLMDIQGSSVLVCLENGWDASAQVVSIAQILLDPYYRTIEGFQMLVEKDWLSFGHKFSYNGSHTSTTSITTFSPIFLQFLDVVHQILKQFPLSFEFNDFYLRTLAYHHCSMRFHTFTADSEKERYANNWLPYRPRMANIHASSVQTEAYVSIWDHIISLHRDSMVFYNFRYQPKDENLEVPPLRPYSYQANIDIWSFYLDNHISQFPPYDTELISEGPLTLLDMHHNFFEKEKSLPLMGVGVNHPSSVASEISSLLWQYTRLMNAYAEKNLNLPQATWMELFNELLASSSTCLFPDPMTVSVDSAMVSHGQTLHKRTTMAVLIKGKLAAELESQFTAPHQFEVMERGRKKLECAFCKHQISRNLGEGVVRCKMCGCVWHTHCRLLMPYNCGQDKQPKRRFSKKKPLPLEITERSNWSRTPSIYFNNSDIPSGSSQLNEGYLYKKGKIIKNWKLRWFVMDTEKGEINYYDSNTDTKSHGTVYLRDVLSVTQAEPQVVPSMKPGEGGFFFNVVTQKRVYSLMALRAAERIEWIARIRAGANARTEQ